MTTTLLDPVELRMRGFDALVKSLGWVNAVRFIHQFERSRLDYTAERDTLLHDWNAHELMEEKVFYPALQSHPQARAIVLEGFQEHHVADVIVAELERVATNDEQWGAKFKVLKENLEHHIQEEEGEMFRVARGIFSKDELRALAQRMMEVRSR